MKSNKAILIIGIFIFAIWATLFLPKNPIYTALNFGPEYNYLFRMILTTTLPLLGILSTTKFAKSIPTGRTRMLVGSIPQTLTYLIFIIFILLAALDCFDACPSYVIKYHPIEGIIFLLYIIAAISIPLYLKNKFIYLSPLFIIIPIYLTLQH